MPELPEVHTTVTGLATVLPGLTITDVWSDWPKQIKSHEFKKFRKLLIGKKFLSVSRKAKNVLLHLGPGDGDTQDSPLGPVSEGSPVCSEFLTLRVHMKMTGQLLFDRPDSKYIHQRFYLSQKHELSFSDLRKFGRIELIVTDKLHEHESLRLLGPEPFAKSLTPRKLAELLLKRKNAPIKQALLDQNLIAGIGNIYGDEILWESDILPNRTVKSLTPKDFTTILRVMRKILTFSIKHGGDSMSDYRNIYGEKGGFQNFHKAYHQTGKACTKRGCSGIIERMKIGARSAHFCRTHQK